MRKERRFIEALWTKVDESSWGEIVDAAMVQAKDGDRYAREWLGKYLLPAPGAESIPEPGALVKALEDELHRRALGGDTAAILASLRALEPTKYGPDAAPPQDEKPIRRIVYDDIEPPADG